MIRRSSRGAGARREEGAARPTRRCGSRARPRWCPRSRTQYSGGVTPAHLEALGRLVEKASPPVRRALAAPAHQAQLVDGARRLDARAFATSAARLLARLDPAGHERSHQAQRAARFLHLSETSEGTRLTGQLDHLAGHRLRLALEAVSPRPGADDERSAEQRRADALDVLAEKVLSAPDTLSGAAVRPHVSLHMTERTWAELRAAHLASTAGGAGASGNVADRHGAATGEGAGASSRTTDPATLDDGTPVPMSEVARALCDCELTRVVVDTEGAVLDVGRSRRTYTGAQRRAVVARDRACAWNDCGTQARWCEVHHIRWWDRDDGATSVDNGVLLCSFHHHEVHRRELTIERVRRPVVRGGSPPGYVAYLFRGPRGRPVSAPAERPVRAQPMSAVGLPPPAPPPGGRRPSATRALEPQLSG
ncbi:DUF222 domain-containing protein [Cellulomonas sp. APG4]|uniref:HNH endonuclease signature motif containing protein n=1 Tax=Cellulomonas sp. APG4 TaxID=1538656 RepID=UPI00137A616C|nr:DUF222 domain-containing protein [Cellulomonas sp. APG4]